MGKLEWVGQCTGVGRSLQTWAWPAVVVRQGLYGSNMGMARYDYMGMARHPRTWAWPAIKVWRGQ